MTISHFAKTVASNPAFVPRDGLTFCNFAVSLVAEAFGITSLSGKRANDIDAWLQSNATKCTGTEAIELAETGALVIASQSSRTGSGHVAVVLPEKDYSVKWGKTVPKVANVGKRNGVMGVNWAFATEPEYYVVG